MPIRAVIFDLDGTLLDTLADVAAAANAALRDCGFPEHPLPAYRMLLGGGVHRLFADALPAGAGTPEQIERCVAAFGRHYRRMWNETTRPFTGIIELIDGLHRRGLKLAVLSNKPHEFTRECIAAHFGADDAAATGTSSSLGASIGPFLFVVGQRAGVPVKPDPASAMEIADALGVSPADVLYLGDTSIDMQTARRAGMRAVGVLWGFRDRAELERAGAEVVIATPEELLTLLAE
ncbi:MAG: HAD family hydrolase [Planctomycetaceae bacterium]|nr:HAD family hydrolase [Planctomycetaceae bacterium]